MTIQPYLRTAHYHETDQMAVIHHANYIRWFEEARVDFMDQTGYSFRRVEEQGVVSPLLEAHCEYRSMVRFGDKVRIFCTITALTHSRMTVSYRVEDESTGELRATGHTRHCFYANGRPVSMKKALPEMYAIFAGLLTQE